VGGVNRLIHPIGPEPAAVYWRRRAWALAGIVIVVVVIILIIHALVSGNEPKGGPTAKPVVSKPPAAKPAEPAACTAEQIGNAHSGAAGEDINLTPDKPSFPDGEPVTFRAQVKNTSDKACTLRNNDHFVSLNIASGSDRIYDSSDCVANVSEDSGDLITLGAGETVAFPVTWNATRSQERCPEITVAPLRAKDATYIAKVTVLGLGSDSPRFLLTP
jgi:hypothetical protein